MSLSCEDIGCDCADPNGVYWRDRAECLEIENAALRNVIRRALNALQIGQSKGAVATILAEMEEGR